MFIEFSKVVFKWPLQMKVTKQEVLFDTVIVTYDLVFDNTQYKLWAGRQASRRETGLPIKAGTLFEMFPFSILFHEDLSVSCIGIALRQVMPQIIGKKVTEFFELVKPLIDFKFENIRSRANNMFELETIEEMDKLGDTGTKKSSGGGGFDDEINLEEVRFMWLHQYFRFW